MVPATFLITVWRSSTIVMVSPMTSEMSNSPESFSLMRVKIALVLKAEISATTSIRVLCSRIFILRAAMCDSREPRLQRSLHSSLPLAFSSSMCCTASTISNQTILWTTHRPSMRTTIHVCLTSLLPSRRINISVKESDLQSDDQVPQRLQRVSLELEGVPTKLAPDGLL